MSDYPINEVFCSLQGEGLHAGTKSVFLRFAGCNLECKRDGDAGFDCDTEFLSGQRLTFDEIDDVVRKCWNPQKCDTIMPRVILTGGEPLLHVDKEFAIQANVRWRVAVETNGTRQLPPGHESWWVSVSPKTAEHTLKVQRANELRYVRNWTQGIPKPMLAANYNWLSPAWGEDDEETQRNLRHCVRLIKQHATWRLSVQQHKLWRLP